MIPEIVLDAVVVEQGVVNVDQKDDGVGHLQACGGTPALHGSIFCRSSIGLMGRQHAFACFAPTAATGCARRSTSCRTSLGRRRFFTPLSELSHDAGAAVLVLGPRGFDSFQT
jgi:hypothetical protein